MHVLITGSAGALGRVIVAGLAERHRLRGYDLQPTIGVEDSVVGDLKDLEGLTAAARGVDGIVHLGAVVGGKHRWEDVLSANIVGMRNTMEAARCAGVRRFVFASRAGLVENYPRNLTRTVDLPTRPLDDYSVSKAFGEQLGHCYHEKFGVEFVAVRIGSFRARQPDTRHPHDLSHGDAVRVFEAALTHPGVGFEIVFGVSDAVWPLYDLDHGRRAVGYRPQDRCELTEQADTSTRFRD
jgi:uronate dehydrogenase